MLYAPAASSARKRPFTRRGRAGIPFLSITCFGRDDVSDNIEFGTFFGDYDVMNILGGIVVFHIKAGLNGSGDTLPLESPDKVTVLKM